MIKINQKSLFIIMVIFLFSTGQRLCFAQQDGDEISIGKYKVIHSNILNEDRLLYVHLPREYEETQLAYPVLYLLYVDLYNYFADAAMATEKLAGSGEMPPVIIIGVANTNRYRDLLPVRTRDSREGGGADQFLQFFGEELIPYVNQNYRTNDFRILAGPQAAAIFSMYSLITKPWLFQAVLSGNPFLNPEILDFLFPRVQSFFENSDTCKCFLYIRCEKDEQPQSLEYAEKLAGLLETESPFGFRSRVEIAEPAGYFLPPLPFREGLRMLFAGYRLPDDFQADSMGDILEYYGKRSEEFGFKVEPPEHLLLYQGDRLNRQGRTKEAIGIFEHQLDLYPRSLNALFQLGETYRRAGEYEKARIYYQKFLDIRQVDAAMIQRRLEEMERIIDGSTAYRIEKEIRVNGLKAGLKKYQAMRSDPRELYFDENEFNALGYRLAGAGDTKGAVAIFKLNVELNPGSANAYDSLAEAYMNRGDSPNAIVNYQKSLELNPDNQNARAMLEKLKKK